MRNLDITKKYKGLVNRKDWETGALKVLPDGLAALCRDGQEFYVFKDSISKFTGFLTDSGEEIYEGDILSPIGKNEDALIKVFWDQLSRTWRAGHSQLEDAPLAECLGSRIVGHEFTHQYKLGNLKPTSPPKSELARL